MEAARTANCKTRYPIVLVHGIGYTDEEYPDYWGRVPAALTRCGAQVYHGGQDSYVRPDLLKCEHQDVSYSKDY